LQFDKGISNERRGKMKSLLAKIRIPALSYIIVILLFFIGYNTVPAPATPETNVEPTVTSTTEKLKVHFIKTPRMGDAILIDLGESEILIDGGLHNSGVSEYIKDHVDGPLEAMVATHPHPDHIGGLIEVLRTFDVNEIWVNGDTLNISPELISSSPWPEAFSKSVELCQMFTSMANKEGASVHVARRGQTMDIGILSFHVFHPDTLLSYSPSRDLRSIFYTMNNNSIVLRLRYGDVTFLFTGEAGKEAEANILEAGLGVQADILKVAHHGSTWASSPQFLKSVMPKLAVYMAPEKPPNLGGGVKRPHPDTIAALSKVGAKVYGTDTHGTIMITTDGKTYTIDTETTPMASEKKEQQPLYTGVHHVALYTGPNTDALSLAKWYEKHFGFKFIELPWSYFAPRPGTGSLEIMKKEPEVKGHLAIEVSDFEAARKDLESKGLELGPTKTLPFVLNAWIKGTDPAGYKIHITHIKK
jgi:beta-lactamase superfamily II metal-dependent hydrolase